MKEFGELVRRTRDARGMRGYDVAFAIGQTPSWLSKLESGAMAHPPAPHVLDALAETRLGITPGRVRQLAIALNLGTKLGRDRLFTEAEIRILQQRNTRPGPHR